MLCIPVHEVFFAVDESLPYMMQVEEFFVSAIRRGLVLRPTDIEVVRDWERRGVPLAVVQAGLLSGIRRFLESAEVHEPLPSSLRFFRRYVEDAFVAHRRAMARGLVVRSSSPVEVAPPTALLLTEALAILDKWLLESTLPAAAGPVLQQARQALQEAAASDSAQSALERIDNELAQRWLEVITPERFSTVLADVEKQVVSGRQRGLGECALDDCRQAALRAAAAEVGYRSLVEAVLDGD